MPVKEVAIGGTSTLVIGGGVGVAVVNNSVEEPPKEILSVNKVPIKVKEVKADGIEFNYLKRFFERQKDSKDNWGAVLDLENQVCQDINGGEDVYSNAFVGKAMAIVSTHGDRKYESKSSELNELLNKFANSISNVKDSNGGLPNHKKFCPEIKIARDNISKILASTNTNQ